MTSHTLVLIVFLFAYATVAVQRIPGLRLDRPSGVTIAATLLLLTGVVTIREAYGFVDWDVITFLLGMMVMIAYLEFAGFFEFAARRLVRLATTPDRLLQVTIVSVALLSALFVNDTICLIFTPILLRATRSLRLDPVPYLIAIAVSSNIGSALTVTGNPQNMYIGIHSGISFLRFSGLMAVPVAAGLLVTYGIIRRRYRDRINQLPLPVIDVAGRSLKRPLAVKSGGALAVTLALFVAGLDYPLASLVGASLIMLVAYVPPRLVLVRVQWTILLFFAGLFTVVGVFSRAGYMESLVRWVAPVLDRAGPGGVGALATVTAVLSNVVSNVPAVLLLQPLVVHLGGGERLWMVLAMASTLAGNLTLVGSVANLIVAERAQARQVHLGFVDYFKVGAPVAVITLVLGTLWLFLVT